MSSMQQTHLDRWLRKKYVYTTHVYCNTLPRTIPEGIAVEETTEESGGMYLYKFMVPNDEALNELTARLEVANITYTSRIADETTTSGKLFNNPHKSFTMQIAWTILLLIIVGVILSGLPVQIWEKYSAKDLDMDKKKQAQTTLVDESFFRSV